jgi:cystine transport system permease protein
MDRVTRIINLLLSSFWKLVVPCLEVTIPLTILSFFFGLILALILALVQVANIKGLCTVKTYVTHSKWRSSLIQPGWDF